MPLEIRELVIKVTISTETGKNTTTMPDEKTLRHWKEGIVKECVENILNRMKIEADR